MRPSKLAQARATGLAKRRSSGAAARRSPLKRHESTTGATRCGRCGAACAGGITVTIDNGVVFHADCFLCDGCGDALRPTVGGGDGGVSFFPAPAGSPGPCFALCRGCYAANVAPKCAGCREPVMDGPSLRAGDGNDVYHLKCFACSSCRRALGGGGGGGGKGAARGGELKTEPFAFHEKRLLCSGCFAEECAPRCKGCGKPIVGAYTEWEGKPYHKGCFACSQCGGAVADAVWAHKESKAPLCTACHDGLYNPRCAGCGEPVASKDLAAGAKARALEALGATWHARCFACHRCRKRLTGRFVDGPPPKGAAGQPQQQQAPMPSIKEMKAALAAARVGIAGVTEKAELAALYRQHCGGGGANAGNGGGGGGKRVPYCTHCHGELFAQRCVLCSAALHGKNKAMLDPWGRVFCAEHRDDPAFGSCYSCNRLCPLGAEPGVGQAAPGDARGGELLRLPDDRRRRMCRACRASSTCAPAACRAALARVKAFFADRHALPFDIDGLRDVDVRLTDQKNLLALCRSRGYHPHNPRLTLGVTLAKTRSRSTTVEHRVAHPPAAARARAHAHGGGGASPARTRTFTVTETKTDAEGIAVLVGLPLTQLETVLAHELCHYWMINTQFPKLPPEVEEGLCELWSVLYLRAQEERRRREGPSAAEQKLEYLRGPRNGHGGGGGGGGGGGTGFRGGAGGTDLSVGAGATGDPAVDAERAKYRYKNHEDVRICETEVAYRLLCIETNKDPVYGVGFRKAERALVAVERLWTRGGAHRSPLHMLFEEVRRCGGWNPAWFGGV